MYTDKMHPPQPIGDCGCEGRAEARRKPGETHSWGIVGRPLAMVYAPLQEFSGILELDEALRTGTIFRELDLPFLCGDTRKGGGCCD